MSRTRTERPSYATPGPTAQEVQNALEVFRSAAALTQRGWRLPKIDRGQLLLEALALAFSGASATQVDDVCQFVLLPALNGLLNGRDKRGHFVANVFGSDARDHLHDLDRNEGEPLVRIKAAIKAAAPHYCRGGRG